MEQEELANLIFGMHELVVSNYEYVKKYKRIRKLESDVFSSLAEYMLGEKYNKMVTGHVHVL